MKLKFCVTTDADEGLTDWDYIELPDGGLLDGDLEREILEAVMRHWSWAEFK
jgi:hypothetical protein